ncbi:D-sedoheptulose-7-phosphate isomerase [Bradyrhizobium sp. USDA 4502]
MVGTSFLGKSEQYLERLGRVLASLDRSELDAGVAEVAKACERGAQIITLGNGGSAMTALHFVTDWGKMVPLATGRPLSARSLVDNMGLITAYANDISFPEVFVHQLRNIMRPGDLIVAISGSGNSENVIQAVDFANANGGITLGLMGFSGGRLRERVTTPVWVRSNDMQLCEDAHAIFGHIVMQSLCGIG